MTKSIVCVNGEYYNQIKPPRVITINGEKFMDATGCFRKLK